MKLAELSRTANVGYKTLANAEACNEVISYEFAVKLAMVLPDTEPEDLLNLPRSEQEESPPSVQEASRPRERAA